MTDIHELDSITAIVAIGLDGAIGSHNDLPWRLRSDLRFFKRTTVNNIVIMGRKTYESIGGCLPNRENLVLSHRAILFEDHAGCHHAHSVAETLYLREKSPKKAAYLIGGAQTFAEFAPFVDRYLLTIVEARFPDADTFLDPKLLEPEEDWSRREISIERLDDPRADEFDFTVFELRHKDPERFQIARARELQNYVERNHLLRKGKPARPRANRADVSLPTFFPA
jgi:dihydrofolate reductase